MTKNYENMIFKEVIETTDSLTWKPYEAGDNITGEYLGSEQGKGRGEGLTFHHISDESDQDVSILGTTVLNNLLKKIDAGDTIRIEYQGEKQTKNGRTYKDYKLYKAEEQ